MGWERWGAATERALYGPAGFYHRPEGGPGRHFRTSATASLHFARALVRLAARVDEALGHPEAFDLVEVAAARGALLTGIAHVAPEEAPDLAPRLLLQGIELAARPAYLPPDIGWATTPGRPLTGLLVANEWLDNVPCDVAELTGTGPRYVEVDERGDERLGDPVTGADRAWLDRWWPLEEEGDRAEIGRPRDARWAEAVGWVERGLAVAIDYGHTREERAAGAYPAGTLTGYRDGREVPPVPDGTTDITAHVAVDAVAGDTGTVADQRTVLRALGIRGAQPDLTRATTHPKAYLEELRAAGEEAELISRGGLGDFRWVLHGRGIAIPVDTV